MKKPKSFTVDRRRWLRGETGAESFLYRERDKKMCCLGFYARACGVKVSDIAQVSTPSKLAELKSITLPSLVSPVGSSGGHVDDDATSRMMDTNDRQGLHTEPEREALLTDLFAKIDVEVKFV